MARKLVSRVSKNAPFLPSKQVHALSPLGAKFHPPFFCFDGYGLTLNLSEKKTVGEFRTKTCISTPIPPLWQGNGTNPAPPLTLDPKLINFYAEVLHLFLETIGRSQMCSSRKGHEFPLFWVGNGYPDRICIRMHTIFRSI